MIAIDHQALLETTAGIGPDSVIDAVGMEPFEETATGYKNIRDNQNEWIKVVVKAN